MGAQEQTGSITTQRLDSKRCGSRDKADMAVHLCWIWVASESSPTQRRGTILSVGWAWQGVAGLNMSDWQKERLPLQLSLHLHTTSRTEEMYYFTLPHVRTGTDKTEKWQLLGPHTPDFSPLVLWWLTPGSLCPRTALCSRLPYPVYCKGVSSPLSLTVCSCSCPKPVSSTISPFPPAAPAPTTAISS